MPVEVTNKLSPEMQEVADARDLVRKCEEDVEVKKGALKLSKAALETAQESLNAAVDAAIDAERQPTLFSRFGGDDLTDPPVEVPPNPPGGPGTGGGDILDAEYEVNLPTVASLPAASGLVPAAGWRRLDVAEHIDAEPDVWEAFAAHGVNTVGELADMLRAGETFGLSAEVVGELKDHVVQASADSDHPVTFEQAEVGEGEKSKGKRRKAAAKKEA